MTRARCRDNQDIHVNGEDPEDQSKRFLMIIIVEDYVEQKTTVPNAIANGCRDIIPMVSGKTRGVGPCCVAECSNLQRSGLPKTQFGSSTWTTTLIPEMH